MRITAKADYAVRAVAELAAAGDRFVASREISTAQGIPQAFLRGILHDLTLAGIVESRRGTEGGHRLARAPAELTVAEVIRAIDGPIAGVAGHAPEDISPVGAAEVLPEVWVATRTALREVLETVTFAHVVSKRLPASVRRRAAAPDAWRRR